MSDERTSRAKDYATAFISVVSLAFAIVSALSSAKSSAAAERNAAVAEKAMAMQRDLYTTKLLVRLTMFPGPDSIDDPEKLQVVVYNRGMDTEIESIHYMLDYGESVMHRKGIDVLKPWSVRQLRRGTSTSFFMNYAWAYWDPAYDDIVGIVVTTSDGEEFKVSLEGTGWFKFDKSGRKRPNGAERFIQELRGAPKPVLRQERPVKPTVDIFKDAW